MNTRIVPLAAFALALAGAACQENWQSLFIRDNKKLGDPPACDIPTDAEAEGLLGGVMDVGQTWGYVAYLYTENNLMKREDYGLPRAESNGIFVQGAYLEFEPDPRVDSSYDPWEITFSNYIPPEGTSTMGVWIVPWAVGRQFERDMVSHTLSELNIVVRIQLFGVTQGGTEVFSQWFRYPITVCRGCVGVCPYGLDASLACRCPTPPPEGDFPCHPGQDDQFDVCIPPEL